MSKLYGSVYCLGLWTPVAASIKILVSTCNYKRLDQFWRNVRVQFHFLSSRLWQWHSMLRLKLSRKMKLMGRDNERGIQEEIKYSYFRNIWWEKPDFFHWSICAHFFPTSFSCFILTSPNLSPDLLSFLILSLLTSPHCDLVPLYSVLCCRMHLWPQFWERSDRKLKRLPSIHRTALDVCWRKNVWNDSMMLLC